VKGLHDCFGAILSSGRKGEYSFICSECGRAYAKLSRRGLSIESRHKPETHVNTIGLKALKAMISELEKA
jgi:hypothetical protein